MAMEYNSIRFNSHKNITIKEIWEKKRKYQIRTQDLTEFGLKMPTSSGLSTSNNWGWAEILKNSFTLVKLGPLHKNGLPSLSIIRVTTHSKRWVTTHSKRWVTTHSKQEVSDNTLKKKKVSTTAKETNYKKITKDQVERIERNLIEFKQKKWLIEYFYLLDYLSHFVYG
jgi:hypothetical protein